MDLHRQLAGWGEYDGLRGFEGGVEALEDGDAEGGCFTGAGLGLGDDIVCFDYGDDGALLDG